MEIKNYNIEKPKPLINIFVKATFHGQDFWTRGHLFDGDWYILTYRGEKIVPLDEIKEWMEIPGINYEG